MNRNPDFTPVRSVTERSLPRQTALLFSTIQLKTLLAIRTLEAL